MSKSKFNVVGFSGTVHLKDGFWHHNGQHYSSVTGLISIIEAKEVAGFNISERESNWVARVTNAEGTVSMTLLGCQVRSIYQGEVPSHTGANCLDMR